MIKSIIKAFKEDCGIGDRSDGLPTRKTAKCQKLRSGCYATFKIGNKKHKTSVCFDHVVPEHVEYGQLYGSRMVIREEVQSGLDQLEELFGKNDFIETHTGQLFHKDYVDDLEFHYVEK